MHIHRTLLSLALACCAALPAQALAQTGHAPAGFGFQVGYALVSGVGDMGDKITANNPQVQVKELLPGGLTLALHRHFGNGLALGLSLGPTVIGAGDASLHVVPVALDLRWHFSRGDGWGAFVRAGVEQSVAGGDFIKTGKTGPVLGVGAEWGRSAGSGWGLELAWHGSDVKVLRNGNRAEKTAQPAEFALGVFAVF